MEQRVNSPDTIYMRTAGSCHGCSVVRGAWTSGTSGAHSISIRQVRWYSAHPAARDAELDTARLQRVYSDLDMPEDAVLGPFVRRVVVSSLGIAVYEAR